MGLAELHQDTLYGQSQLPSLSYPTTIDKSPGHMLLVKPGPLNESETEVAHSHPDATLAVSDELCNGHDKAC